MQKGEGHGLPFFYVQDVRYLKNAGAIFKVFEKYFMSSSPNASIGGPAALKILDFR